jgi:hypothetical protein
VVGHGTHPLAAACGQDHRLARAFERLAHAAAVRACAD